MIVSTEECPNPNTIFDSTNAELGNVRSVIDFNTGKILGSDFDYKCRSGYVLFVSKQGGDYKRAPSDMITYECRRRTGSTFESDPSIEEHGQPKCKLSIPAMCQSNFPRCRPLPSIPNGAVSYGNREPGDFATYSCREEYRLTPVGQDKRECSKDGNWSGKDPKCESKK